jgi:hypothetical protein
MLSLFLPHRGLVSFALSLPTTQTLKHYKPLYNKKGEKVQNSQKGQ